MRLAGLTSIFVVLTAASCASAPQPEAPVSAERIRYEVINPAFCGDCDGTTIVATPAGEVWVERKRWERQGRPVRDSFDVAPERYQAFRKALASYRPLVSRTAADVPCSAFELHSANVLVTWTDHGTEVSRMFLLGCADEAAANMAIIEAASELGISGVPW